MNAPFAPDWTPDAWRRHDARQQPSFADPAALAAVEARLKAARGVVAIDECAALRHASAALGNGLILQGGDCAENFDDAIAERVARLASLFDTLAGIIHEHTARETLRIARIAGQFAKPRSAPDEQRGRVTLPAYRGDIINGQAFSASARTPDPQRMIRAHLQSVGTAATIAAARHGTSPLFTSHEALLLAYEEAQVRRDADGRWWATSGHMLWLGDRTRQLDGAHVAFLRGIENVVGVKCGPTLEADELEALLDRLDPARQEGRIVLIARLGVDRVEERLPALLAATRRRPVHWIVDPMHGNTVKEEGRKLRRYGSMLEEARLFFRLCEEAGVRPAGIHLEMSPDAVTECLGGGGPETLDDLDHAYRTACDPRLNGEQAINFVTELVSR